MAIEPTKTQLENRERALKGLPVMDATTLETQETPVTPQTVPPVTTPDISSLSADVQETLSPVEQTLSEAQKRAMELTGVGAEKEAKRAKLEVETPVVEAQRQIQRDIASQLSGLQAEALKETTRAEGRLAPTFAIRGEQAQIERQRAVKALSLSAQLDASQGLLSSALNKIDRAIEAEFGPRETELDTLLKNIEILKSDPRLTREEEKRADARKLALEKELSKIEEDKQNKKDIQSIAVEASSLGASADVIRKITEAPTYSKALEIASKNNVVDTTKVLEKKLLEEQIQTQITNRAINLEELSLKKAKSKEEKNAIVEARKEEIEKNISKIPAIDDKINQISGLYNPETGAVHKGLNSAVGPTFAQRIALKDIGGAKDDFIASVQQLISKETLDTLLNLKAQGGTLGALNQSELVMLNGAASKIGTWAITNKEGKVTGYEASEDSFKQELATILNLTRRAKNRALSDTITQEDEDEINSLY